MTLMALIPSSTASTRKRPAAYISHENLTEIDDQDLYNNLQIDSDYIFADINSREIVWFKNIFTSWSQDERRSFVKFVTEDSDLPPNGFAGYDPKITIGFTSREPVYYPTVYTQFHKIEFPRYTSEAQMREKLEQAMAYYGL